MMIVLVPIDGSAAAMRALALALKEVRREPQAVLHLLNVQAPPLHPWPGRLVSQDLIDAELHQRGMELLANAREMALGPGLEVRLHVRIGQVAEEIVRCADQQRCDAIVMGTRGMGAAVGLALGSIATRVVHLSHLPVTLVK